MTRAAHEAVVLHDGECETYRRRDYDRREPVAHLLRLEGARP